MELLPKPSKNNSRENGYYGVCRNVAKPLTIYADLFTRKPKLNNSVFLYQKAHRLLTGFSFAQQVV
jgi:hypothetical protein